MQRVRMLKSTCNLHICFAVYTRCTSGKSGVTIQRPFGAWGCSLIAHAHANNAGRRQPMPAESFITETSPVQPSASTWWKRDAIIDEFDSFLRVYSSRPYGREHGGMMIEHSFGMWFILIFLPTLLIVEYYTFIMLFMIHNSFFLATMVFWDLELSRVMLGGLLARLFPT